MTMDPELIESFVIESRDMLDEVEPTLIELQNSSSVGELDDELLSSIFRLFHSMKGSAGFMALDTIAGVTHEAETLLDLFRKGKADFNVSYTTLLCESIDLMRLLLDRVEETHEDKGLESEADLIKDKLKKAINSAKDGESAPAPDLPPPPPAKPAPEAAEMAQAAPYEVSISITDEMKKRFVLEADEQIEMAEECLLGVEKDPEGREEMIHKAFRALHSLKGNAGFMGYADLERLAHRTEEVLEAIKDGRADADDGNIGVILQIQDVLRDCVADIAHGGEGAIQSCDIFIELVSDILPEEPASSPETASTPTGRETEGDGPKLPTGPRLMVIDDEESICRLLEECLRKANYRAEAFTDPEAGLARLSKPEGSDFSLLVCDLRLPGTNGQEVIKKARNIQNDLSVIVITGYGSKEVLGELVNMSIQGYIEKSPDGFDMKQILVQIEEALKKRPTRKPAPKAAAGASRGRTVARSDIRVDLQKLDRLVNLVGELVIAETMVTRCPALTDLEDEDFDKAVHHLRRITSDLQDVAMSVRMIPLSSTFRKMIRLVHDLAGKQKKQIKLDLIGEDTEVDKTVIEKINDPLVHIVRNAADHGMEPPRDRIELGKPEQGTITIEARHEGGEVWILISDDGRGLNKEVILEKGLERGLVQGDGSDMTDEQIYKLVFEPGFSTAAAVTDVSGRGVGMDVVKKNIEALNGKIDVMSKAGQGTTITLRIPLTLAIIDGMLVRVGSTCYTIPMLSIRESLRSAPQAITKTPDREELVRVREEMIPIIRLHRVFEKACDHEALEDGILVVVESESETYALFVDEILGQQETVIKGLSQYLGKARGISGCMILGDGSVSLILDIEGVYEMHNLRLEAEGQGKRGARTIEPATKT